MALFGPSCGIFESSAPSASGATSPSPNLFGSISQSNPFGSNQNKLMFDSKPFGSPTLFEAQAGSSTYDGIFGPTQASPLGFSTPAFSSSMMPSFGCTSSSGSGTSFHRENIKPAIVFGGFGFPSTQGNALGSTTFSQTQPAFGSTAFGASTPVFGSTSFGSTTPAFGALSNSASGALPTPSFGASSIPASSASSFPAFGGTSAPMFGSTTPTFGQAAPTFVITLVFGTGGAASPFATSTPVFGVSPSFRSTMLAQQWSGSRTTPYNVTNETPSFGSTILAQQWSGSRTTPYNVTNDMLKGSSPSFGSTMFGCPGSRTTSYRVTNDAEAGIGGQVGKLTPISAMPDYKSKSFEELRWEDCQAGDRGGSRPLVGLPAAVPCGSMTMSPFGATSTPTLTANLFAADTSGPFGSKLAGSFVLTSSAPFATSASPWGTLSTGSIFGGQSYSGLGIGVSSTSGTGTYSSFDSGFASAASPSFDSSFASAASPFSKPVPSISNPSNTATFGSNPIGQTQSSAAIFTTPTPSAFNKSNTSTFGLNPFEQTQSRAALFSGSNQPFASAASPFHRKFCASSLFGSSPSPFQNSNPWGSMFSANPAHPQIPSVGGQSQPAGSAFGTPFVVGAGASTLQQPSVPVPVTNPSSTLPKLTQTWIGQTSGMGPSLQFSLPLSSTGSIGFSFGHDNLQIMLSGLHL